MLQKYILTHCLSFSTRLFENDVEMYGAQTKPVALFALSQFENDVEMYGAQTNKIT